MSVREPFADAVVVGVFSLVILLLFRRGLDTFPLDDAYIHLSVSRTFALGGGLGLSDATPGLGTTSLLWTVLLLPLAYLPLSPFLYVSILTALSHACVCVSASSLTRHLLSTGSLGPLAVRAISMLVGLLVSTTGSVLWFSSSGMETSLCCAILLLLLLRVLKEGFSPSASGFAILLFLCRPSEGVVVVPLVLLAALTKRNIHRGSLLALPLVVVAYFGLCLYLTGGLLPPTMVGKRLSFVPHAFDWFWGKRFVADLWAFQSHNPGLRILLLISGGLGVVWSIFRCLRRTDRREFRRGDLLVCVAVGFFILVMTAIGFPTLFQLSRYVATLYPLMTVVGAVTVVTAASHARYSIPVLAIVLTFNLSSLPGWRKSLLDQGDHIRLAYVGTANWLRENTPADAVVAAFDVGVLSFFSDRMIVDLGGVTNRDAHACLPRRHCSALLRQKRVTYLVSVQDPDTDAFTGLQKLTLQWPKSANTTLVYEAGVGFYPSPTLTNSRRLQVRRINGWGSPESLAALESHPRGDILDYRSIELRTPERGTRVCIGITGPQAPLPPRDWTTIHGVIRKRVGSAQLVIPAYQICASRDGEPNLRHCITTEPLTPTKEWEGHSIETKFQLGVRTSLAAKELKFYIRLAPAEAPTPLQVSSLDESWSPIGSLPKERGKLPAPQAPCGTE